MEFKWMLKWIKVLACSISYAFAIILCWVWSAAYFGGYYAVIFTINDYGEAFPELIMWIILLPVLTIGTYYNFKEVFRELVKSD